MYAKFAQWALRCIPREDRMGRSPYEIVTGLRPQGISQHLFEKLKGKIINPNSYANPVNQYLQKVHEQIADQLKIESKGKRFNAEGVSGTDLKVGESFTPIS